MSIEIRNMNKINLFCLPYAGGSSFIFESWRRRIHPSIELIPIEYPGRGFRMSEPLYSDLNKIVDDVYERIRPRLCEAPYSLFGHSMGSIVAFELAHRIAGNQLNSPVHIFFSGHSAPNIVKTEPPMYLLSDEDFKEKLLDLEGTPKEVLENKELMEMYLPVLRADFQAIEQYRYNEKDTLSCDFSVLYGNQDKVKIGELLPWKKLTSRSCEYTPLNGGHFFINTCSSDVISIINAILTHK